MNSKLGYHVNKVYLYICLFILGPATLAVCDQESRRNFLQMLTYRLQKQKAIHFYHLRAYVKFLFLFFKFFYEF